MSKTTADYNDLEIRQKKRWLKSYIAHGAITDIEKLKKVRDIYWSGSRGIWDKHSPEWRTGFVNASILASGIQLFLGGYYTHQCGDPESLENIKHRVKEARFCKVDGNDVHFPGVEAVKTYHKNIIKSKKSLVEFGGIDYYKEHLRGVAYAARIFGIKFS